MTADCTIVTEEGVEITIDRRKQSLTIKPEYGETITLRWFDLIEVCAILLSEIRDFKYVEDQGSNNTGTEGTTNPGD